MSKPSLSSKTSNTSSSSGVWKKGLCECADDATLCCSVCWCQCNATGQAYARTVAPARRKKTCLITAGVLWCLFVFAQIFSQTSNALINTAIENECTWFGLCQLVIDWDQVSAGYVLGGLASLFACASTIFGTYILCTARRRIRQRARIATGSDLDDCCVSYWCGCCAIIQMLRQDDVTGSNYRACTIIGV